MSTSTALAGRQRTSPQRTFGGPGTGPGRFRAPAGIAVDARGQVWVADTGNDRVQAFDRDGRLVRVLAGRLKAPEAIAVDAAGHVYVADTGNGRVVQYAWWGGFVREFGARELDGPRGTALDAAGRLLVADPGHRRVARFDTRTGAALADLTEGAGAPHGIAADGTGGAWIVQTGPDAVVHHASDGRVLESLAAPGTPAGIALSGALSGEVHVTVPEHGRLVRLPDTEVSGALSGPLGLAADPLGGFWVADTGNSRIVHMG